MSERWMPILGYEGCYEVSDLGRARSLDRIAQRLHQSGAPSNLAVHGRLLRVRRRADGRPVITLKKDGKAATYLVYVLVLEAFVGPRPEGAHACHNDGDPTNTNLGNLRWDTPSGNAYDKGRHGTDHKRNRTHCPRLHRLVEPNLDATIAARGHRNCLACGRARKAKWKANRRGVVGFDFDAYADRAYQRIMGEAA